MGDVEKVIFEGRVYRRYPKSDDCRHWYFQSHSKVLGSKFLHIEIWKRHFGDIAAGMVVHHKDEDPSNNAIGNLECVTRAEHTRHHKLREWSDGTLGKRRRKKCKCCKKTFY